MEMTPLPRSGSPPPPHSLFLSRPLLPPAVALGGRRGHTGQNCIGEAQPGCGPWKPRGDRPEPGKLQAPSLIGREVEVSRGPGPFPGPVPGRGDLRVASVPSLAARAPSCSSPRSCARASSLRPRTGLPGITRAGAKRGPASSSHQPRCLRTLVSFSPNQGEEAPEVPSRPTWARKRSRRMFGASAPGATAARNLGSGPSLPRLRPGLEPHAECLTGLHLTPRPPLRTQPFLK